MQVSKAIAAQKFLDETMSQLTYHGLCELSAKMKEVTPEDIITSVTETECYPIHHLISFVGRTCCVLPKQSFLYNIQVENGEKHDKTSKFTPVEALAQ